MTSFIDGNEHTARNVFGKTILGQIPPTTGITNLNQIQAVMNSAPLLPCGDRSVFVISGQVQNIQGDASDPIRLLYSKQYGVIHIGGKGKIFSIHNGAVGDVIFQTP
jgi:hypothetical protein